MEEPRPKIDYTNRFKTFEQLKPAPKDTWSLIYPCLLRNRSWHPPTKDEKGSITKLLTNYFNLRVGLSKVDLSSISSAVNEMTEAAKFLNLDIIHYQQKDVLIVIPSNYTVNYSGVIMILRLGPTNNVVIVSPHDLSDYTNHVTKIAVTDTLALACFSNAQKRLKPSDPQRDIQDFVHSNNHLGNFTIKEFTKLFKTVCPQSELTCLHMHGMSKDSKILVRCRNDEMERKFKSVFGGFGFQLFDSFNAGYTIDEYFGDHYLKCEIPVKIYKNRPEIVKKIVETISR
jgi:hypothetical protein